MEIATAIGGALLSPAFQLLLNKLDSGELRHYARQGHVLGDLKNWENKLKIIFAVLDDAEKKQMTGELVKIWLNELRDLAYDVEDVVDDFDTEARRHKLAVANSRRLKLKLIPACCRKSSTITFNAQTLSRIERINARFESIIKDKDSLQLVEPDAKGRATRARGSSITTSLVNEAKVYGRKEDKEAILKLMEAETSSAQVSIIPIVGMVGVGKTTLAQLIYNDSNLKFDLKAWVCVGEDFVVSKITKTILGSKDCDGDDLNSLQVKLKEKLSGKKFLVVLDDIWTENYDYWTLFQAPFEAGVGGSTIIITTRNAGVASKMCSVTVTPYRLQKLSYADCRCILVQHALGTTSFDEYPDLKDVGENIADRCQGLPLAAKTLGGILKGKTNRDAWEDVLRSKVWDLPEDNGILPALRLSYHHLPSHLKRCFSYCAIIPKDYEFEKHDLVLLWMAEGLLQLSRGKKMEDVGLEYFDELVSRSLFEPSSDGEAFVMHDLVKNLAHSVAGETCFDPFDDLGDGLMYGDFEKVRHLTFTYLTEETSKKLEVLLSKMKHLRTFVVLSGRRRRHGYTDVVLQKLAQELRCLTALTDEVLQKLVQELRCLRVLSLDHATITQLPSLIGEMKHLRYLNLSHTGVKQLPETVGELLNLQVLMLCGCKDLTSLPESIMNLIKLHILDISDTKSLEEMPAGVGKLTCLQGLAKFIVAKVDGLRLRDLKDLLHLQGKLSIKRLHNVADDLDAKEANLKNKEGINTLKMEWSEDFSSSRNEIADKLVLDSLKPPRNLEKLKITFFGGAAFPQWLGDQSFEKLVHLEFVGCRNSLSLPSLGRLPLLKYLFIEDAESVRTVGREFYVDDQPFQSLETLMFKNMVCWEHWACREVCFPRLRELKLQNCPKLRGNLPQHLPSLKQLHISVCPQLEDSLTSLPCLRELYLKECHSSMLESGLRELSSLQRLDIEEIPMVSFPDDDGKLLPTSLAHLSIRRSPQLEAISRGIQNLTSLEELIFFHCKNLSFLPNECLPVSLQSLNIHGCPALELRCSEEDRYCLLINSRIQQRDTGSYFFNVKTLEENPDACVIQ